MTKKIHWFIVIGLLTLGYIWVCLAYQEPGLIRDAFTLGFVLWLFGFDLRWSTSPRGEQ